ncbi:unnamed protein product [Calypogeia fissa]
MRRKGEVTMGEEGSSFESFLAYSRALKKTPQRVWQRGLWASLPEAELQHVKASPGAALRRHLDWYEVVGMGVGGMLGAGIFVITGSVARNIAGPAVIVSYLLAGLTALLSAFCYTEFAVELPVAGGAFSYLKITLGEFAAYFTGANLIMEYVLSNAAVARTFLPYLISAFSSESADAWRIKASGLAIGFNHLDFVALSLVLLITIGLCYSSKHSAICNLAVTVVHLIFIIFIILVGFSKGNWANLLEPGNKSNLGGFSPYGVQGICNGAAIVYFSYIGYDAVSTMAEEAKNPSITMPIGVSGSVMIVTIIYTLMAAAICLLQPYDQIDPKAPFANAFKEMRGWEWASSFVGGGASLGILTSIMVAMFGQARYLCVIGRSHVVPRWFSIVNPDTCTPVNATISLGICTAVISLFIDVDVLLNMVSIGTLFVFYMVANALIFHRHAGQRIDNLVPTLSFLSFLSASSLSFVSVWTFYPGCWWGLLLFGGLSIILTMTFYYSVPAANEAKVRQLPGMSIVASMSIFFNVLLLGSVDGLAFARFAIWSGIAIAFYLLYGVHAAHDAAEFTRNTIAFVRLENIEMEGGRGTK